MSQFVPVLPQPKSSNTPGTLVERDSSGNFAGEVITATHLETDGTAVPSMTLDSAAGSGATYSISGSDNCFALTIATGTGTMGTMATIGSVTFGKPFASAPQVAIIPADSAAWSLGSSKTPTAGSVTASGFNLVAGTSPLTSSANIAFLIIVIG